MELRSDNYFSEEAMRTYWSVSQFKEFNRCEARGLASVTGHYRREETDALLIGSYVDAYFSGERMLFEERHRDQMFTKKGELFAKFRHASDLIRRVEADPLMMDYLDGEKQVIREADLFSIPWKIKMDVYNGRRIVDLKVVKDFGDIYDPGYGRRSWIEYWGYDIQGAIYQEVERISSGHDDPLPFYIAAVTKERVPDIKVIQIPQHILDAAKHLVEAKIERFDLIKTGQVEPIRCETCEYCKGTKVLKAPEVYEIAEA